MELQSHSLVYGSPNAVAHSWSEVPALLLVPRPLMLCFRLKVASKMQPGSIVPDLFAQRFQVPGVMVVSLCFVIDWSFLLPLIEFVEVDLSAFPVAVVEKTGTELPLELQKPLPPLFLIYLFFEFTSFAQVAA